MTEKFDNKSQQIGEFLKTSERVKLVADAILEVDGIADETHGERVKRAEWCDSRTDSTVILSRELSMDTNDAYYYFRQYDPTYEDGLESKKNFYTDTSLNYTVRRLNKNDEFLPLAEGDTSPADELLDLLTHGPLENPQKFLNQHENRVVGERFQSLIGSYALSDSNVIRNINAAFHVGNTNKKEAALAAIVDKLIQQYGLDGLSEEAAYRAIQSFRKSGSYSPSNYIRRPKKA